MITSSHLELPSRFSGVTLLRWVARLGSLAVFAFWGMFFVEHVVEWFVRAEAYPPAIVWLAMFLHLCLLVGLLIGWRWELAGGLMSILAALGFLYFIRGRHSGQLPAFLLATLTPGMLWLIVGGYSWGRRALPQPHN